MMTVSIYIDTSKQVGDPDHLKVFGGADAADAWLKERKPEGVAFEYPVSWRDVGRPWPPTMNVRFSSGPAVRHPEGPRRTTRRS